MEALLLSSCSHEEMKNFPEVGCGEGCVRNPHGPQLPRLGCVRAAIVGWTNEGQGDIYLLYDRSDGIDKPASTMTSWRTGTLSASLLFILGEGSVAASSLRRGGAASCHLGKADDSLWRVAA